MWASRLFLFSCVLYVASLTGNLLVVQLSITELLFCSSTAPKMIYDLFRKHMTISFGACVLQIFFIHTPRGTKMVLLIAMAFDRYMTICKPLHYLTIMSPLRCILFLITAWIIGLVHSVIQLAFVVDLPLCGPNELDSFFLDLYIGIHGGLSKALSTLSAHVTRVVLFFGPFIFFYIWPFPTSHLDKFLAIFDAFITPFLNSVIYTFRNKEMKVAMR
uniref:G-protein coupled receptors family 1 profile domain-containing protein n=1 Tax=Cavia porcellus TaxID=10141 RepID=A0A286XX84_CAVPO